MSDIEDDREDATDAFFDMSLEEHDILLGATEEDEVEEDEDNE